MNHCLPYYYFNIVCLIFTLILKIKIYSIINNVFYIYTYCIVKLNLFFKLLIQGMVKPCILIQTFYTLRFEVQ